MENLKEVRFDKYCETCKHDAEKTNPNVGEYDGENWSGVTTKEEYIPCCYCIGIAVRDETEVPQYWEEK